MLCITFIESLFFLIAFQVQSQTLGFSIVTSGQSQETNRGAEPFIIRLSGLFDIYQRQSNLENETCDRSKILSSSIQVNEMISYTINKINDDPNILPGVRIVLDSKADCNIDTLALAQIVRDILPLQTTARAVPKNDTYWGVIGPVTSGVAIPTAKLLGLFHLPQISYSATSPALSEKRRFPYFFRTVSSDVYQVRAIVKLLLLNRWDYVSFIYDDDDYGNAAFEVFNREIENTSICLAVGVKIKRNPDEADLMGSLNVLDNEHRAKVVIAFVEEFNLVSMFKLMYKHRLLEGFQLIGSDSWLTLSTNFSLYTNDTKLAKAIPHIIDGAITFNGHFPEDEYTKGFVAHIKTKTMKEARASNGFFQHYLAYFEGCTIENSSNTCRDNLTLPDDVVLTSLLTAASTSARMFAHALEEARRLLCNPNVPIFDCTAFTTMPGSQLRSFLQNVTLSYNANDSFVLDEQQDGPAWYNIWRYNKSYASGWQSIGYFRDNAIEIDNNLPGHPEEGRGNVTSTCSDKCSQNQFMSIWEDKTCCWTCYECKVNSIVAWNFSTVNLPYRNVSGCSECEEFEYPNGTRCSDIPHTYLSFEKPLAWCVAAGSTVGLVLTIFTAIVYWHAWNTPLIRASGRELSVVILSGLVLVFSVSFLFCFEPTVLLCTLRRVCTGMCFTLVYAGVLVKTVRISFIFNTLGKKLISSYKRFLEPAPQVIIAFTLTSVELFVIGIWFVQVRPEVTRETNTSKNEARDQFTVVFVDCKGLKSHDLLIGLSYPILLLLICTIYAIKIRKVPAGFNEAKHIGFLVYTTLVIWLAQLSTYFVLTSSDIVFRDAIYCFGLCLNGLIIILALFGPKVYIILLRPEKNNQRMVMGSTRARDCTTVSYVESKRRRQSSLNSSEIGRREQNNNHRVAIPQIALGAELKCCPKCGWKFSCTERNSVSIPRRQSLPAVFSTTLCTSGKSNISNELNSDLRKRRSAKKPISERSPVLLRKNNTLKKNNSLSSNHCLHVDTAALSPEHENKNDREDKLNKCCEPPTNDEMKPIEITPKIHEYNNPGYENDRTLS